MGISNTGNTLLSFPNKQFFLNHIYHTPHLTTNLISVSRFCSDNHVLPLLLLRIRSPRKLFSKAPSRMACIHSLLSSLVPSSPPMSPPHQISSPSGMLALATLLIPLYILHLLLVIPTKNIIKNIAFCSSCPLAKSKQLPFSLSSSHASAPLELLHLDLWGPAPCMSTTGACYFLLLVDDFS